MAATTQIKIIDYGQDQKTGHISIRVKSQTVDGNSSWEGPEMVYGVDAVSFVKRFNSDIEQVKTWIAGQHKVYIGASKSLAEELEKLKGQVIG